MADNTGDNTGGDQPGRNDGRPFAKGRSGNPAGRPKGARNRVTMAIEEMLEGEGAAITRKVIEMAKAGDTIALRLCMERVAPLRRGRSVLFDLPPVESASDLGKALGHILRATANGALTPDEAATIAGVLETKRRAIETGELELRLDQLEQRLTPGPVRWITEWIGAYDGWSAAPPWGCLSVGRHGNGPTSSFWL